MLALNRFVVPPERTAEFTAQAQQALAVFAARPGYQGGELTRALDDPAHWCLLTRWASVGAYRRALGHFDVKMYATPLLASAEPDPAGFEVLAEAAPEGPVTRYDSDRAEHDHAA
ncbi:antibiotic biosynthesis monooxygenase [Natronosporangium hydrolyticum]|uniref:Antibiotic biosynthesis monooxygenase n=1 Tax=Natronosporangium hydrolyticum TaxID=2811111 RepID=A0A895YCV0_9ACTN|nr:antibiotic biosynthesis monooxygenase family protein [Natronosporangium hydrolyticum]QSB13179.1 antibiotic biosynthesis monooxygenase [Natronosporangium hydrolyticum]